MAKGHKKGELALPHSGNGWISPSPQPCLLLLLKKQYLGTSLGLMLCSAPLEWEFQRCQAAQNTWAVFSNSRRPGKDLCFSRDVTDPSSNLRREDFSVAGTSVVLSSCVNSRESKESKSLWQNFLMTYFSHNMEKKWYPWEFFPLLRWCWNQTAALQVTQDWQT